MGDRDREILLALYEASTESADSFKKELTRLRSELTSAVGDRANAWYAICVEQKDMEMGMAFCAIASVIFSLVGEREKAFQALINKHEVWYMLAESEKQYEEVYSSLVSVLSAPDPKWKGSQLPKLQGRILAADCGFFASKATTNSKDKKRWLDAALEWLQDGSKYLVEAQTTRLIQAYGSTAVAVYLACVEQGSVGEPWTAKRLVTITASLDHAMPDKIVYTGNSTKTSQFDATRSEMSALFNRGAYQGDSKAHAQSSDQRPLGLFGRKKG